MEFREHRGYLVIVARKRVYLDVCCLSRPSDDLRIDRNRLEAEAVLAIVAHADQGDWDLLNSPAIQYEVRQSADPARKEAVWQLLEAARLAVVAGPAHYRRASELTQLGLGDLDALHIACAEAGRADVFLTTDDILLKRANRQRLRIRVSVENPLHWLLEQRP